MKYITTEFLKFCVSRRVIFISEESEIKCCRTLFFVLRLPYMQYKTVLHLNIIVVEKLQNWYLCMK